MQTKKSLLFNEDIPWAKNESNEDLMEQIYEN